MEIAIEGSQVKAILVELCTILQKSPTFPQELTLVGAQVLYQSFRKEMGSTKMESTMRKYTDAAFQGMLIRYVTLDDSRNIKELIKTISSNCPEPLIVIDFAQEAPTTSKTEVDVYFFHCPYPFLPSKEKLEADYKERQLKPVDLYTLITLNVLSPCLFLENFNNATYWAKDEEWYFAFFSKEYMYVNEYPDSDPWPTDPRKIWFAGIR